MVRFFNSAKGGGGCTVVKQNVTRLSTTGIVLRFRNI